MIIVHCIAYFSKFDDIRKPTTSKFFNTNFRKNTWFRVWVYLYKKLYYFSANEVQESRLIAKCQEFSAEFRFFPVNYGIGFCNIFPTIFSLLTE